MILTAKFWVVLLLLTTTALIMYRRGNVDRVPPSTPLGEMPMIIGTWAGTEIPLDASTLDVLGKGIFLNRTYMPSVVTPLAPKTGSIGLFIGYFPTQRSGQSIHSPQNCLPGSGWTFESSGVTQVKSVGDSRYNVGEYVISNGKTREEVLYWYRSHGRSISGDYLAKFYTLVDSIRDGRTDAALIRVITPIMPGESQHDAHARAVGFAEMITPMLPAYVPD